MKDIYVINHIWIFKLNLKFLSQINIKIACDEKKENYLENSFCNFENAHENSDIDEDNIFNFKMPDNEEDYYVANNVIRFGND